jgi:hypothetical protein
MSLNVGDKVKVKSGLTNSDAEGSIIKVQYFVQFADKTATCYNDGDLIPAEVEPLKVEAVAKAVPATVKK